MTEMHILDPHRDNLDFAPRLHYEHVISSSEGKKTNEPKHETFCLSKNKKHQHMDGRKQQRGKTLPP